jgi:riboflavin kinase/FMN adenylyltransferase
VAEFLFHRLKAKHLFCGENYRFGKNASSDVNDLKKLASAFGIEVTVVPFVEEDCEVINSTRIRKLLEDGDVHHADKLLGRGFVIDFEVKKGKRLGHELGFPTINQYLPGWFCNLRHGVYASATMIDEIWLPSVTNIGVRPTVGGEGICAETHIPGFDEELYGYFINVRLDKFLRPEQKFSGLEELKSQIAADTASAMIK